MSVNKETMSLMEKQLWNLETTLRENDEVDRRIQEQSDRLLQAKTRQQEMMYAMANRIDALYCKWQDYQSQQQSRLEESFNVASVNLSKDYRKPLKPEEVVQMKNKLKIVEDKIHILSKLDVTATLIHRPASQNAIKLEQVVNKARELEIRLKKIADMLNNKVDPNEEARKVLQVELEKLVKAEGDKRELESALRAFLEKNRTSPTTSSVSLKNGEISATKIAESAVAIDSLTNITKQE